MFLLSMIFLISLGFILHNINIKSVDIFCNFQALVENLFSYKIKYFQSDDGIEFDNGPKLAHFFKHGIYF